MKIDRITVKNYRLLKDFRMDLEDELSLVVGKNNTGKTALLTVMDKFLNKSDSDKFSFDDINVDLQNVIKTLVEEGKDFSDEIIGIEMKLLIKYDCEDNLANLSRVMMDLDPNNFFILLSFSYTLGSESLLKLRDHYHSFKRKEKEKEVVNKNYQAKDLFHFLKNHHRNYFKTSIKSLSYNKESGEEGGDSIDLDKENISLKNIINFKFIRARRDVTNKEVDKTLSIQASRIYLKTYDRDGQTDQIEEFKDKLIETDDELTKVYEGLFKKTVEKVKKFGGLEKGESIINIESTLQHRDLIRGNTTVTYTYGEHSFPESYNGLGYMNLISIIFEIEILIQEFKRKKNEVPADINLLFIEEPESHTHPQMQYVFINNIKNLLKEGIVREDKNWNLQYIVSTHSSHIVAESDFNDIRYFKRVGDTEVIAKSLKSLEGEYKEAGEEKNFRFLKQYLTLNKAELFFADKAIFVEGDTERILLPAMMKKVDQENKENPLLSQNISLVVVGSHSHVFEKFIKFIGIKTLIITDIDSAKEDRKACKNDPNAEISTNSSLKFFLGKELSELKSKNLEQKRLKKGTIERCVGRGIEKTEKWIQDDKGYVQIVYQVEEKSGKESYHARSFEDGFVHINKAFLNKNKDTFDSLIKKHFEYLKNGDPYEFARKAIKKKTSFAVEILLNSTEDKEGNKFSNWNIPTYIKEGLIWLKES